MIYLMVLLAHGPRHPGASDADERHEAFITELIRQNRILLGGKWSRMAGPFAAGYLLHCDSMAEGKRIVDGDPYVMEGVYEPTLVEWLLVGINPKAIEDELVLTSENL